MNLIEQLGGYEAAKDKFRDNGSFHSDRIKSALLQYRRENNIFEVGDYIILPYDDDYESFQKITFINDKHGLYEYSNGCCGYGGKIRHATPEEIKAGHRL